MGDKTGIEWTDTTWNPVRGCSRVSEGCRHCYAERVAARFSGPGQPYEGLAKRHLRVVGVDNQPYWRWTGDVRFVTEHLADPLKWRKPRRIFVNSMSDLFHESLTNEQIAAVFGVMAACPHHTFQVLTKRASRMREWFAWIVRKEPVAHARPICWAYAFDSIKGLQHRGAYGRSVDMEERMRPTSMSWPLANVWLGVSVENQAAVDERIPELLATPAAVRFLSCEPLLDAVDLHAIQIPGARTGLRFSALQDQHDDRFGRSDTTIDWVIAGCESGPGARPCDVAWLRSLRDQCLAAGTKFFLKQAMYTPNEWVPGLSSTLVIGAGDGSHRKPGGLVGLPYLDGVKHNAIPEVG